MAKKATKKSSKSKSESVPKRKYKVLDEGTFINGAPQEQNAVVQMTEQEARRCTDAGVRLSCME